MKPRRGSGVESQAPRHVADVRALEPADLPQATALFELVMGSEIGRSKPGDLVELFRRTLLESPWTDPELPSLVAIDERGQVIGFIGTEVRRLRLGKRSARAVWCQHFVVDPAARHLGVGAVLLRRVLKGPQDVTFTDNGSDVVRQMWGGLGGQVLDLKGIHWVRLFRPWQVAAHATSALARPRLRSGLRRLSGPLDNASVAVAGRFLEPTASGDAAASLTPQTLLDALPTVARRMSLHPDYDETFLEWLFEELTRVESRGRLVAHLVQDESGRTAGWYLYYLRPGWRSEVLQVAADERDLGRVLDHLLSHAYAHGSAAVRGRLEPGHVEAVVDRRCLLWYRGGALIHSRDPELQSAIHSQRALVTRLEGEWWGDTFI